MKPILRILALTLLAGQLTAATVILVRHADRAGGMTGDVPLNERGKQRAESLSRLLADAGVSEIYVTDVQRTQQTAAPLAARLNLTPIVLPGANVNELVDRLKKLGPEKTVLVVGHSNTVPQIVEGMGGAVPAISETEFNRMLIVTTGGGKPGVVTLRYGD